MSLRKRVNEWMFRRIHGGTLVFNDCREDPRIDRVALGLGEDDEVLVITSAGCNALDYLMCGPRRVYAVDVNPRQNWLFELKLAGLRGLDYDTFFGFFGRGYLPDARQRYTESLRPHLSGDARAYWDRHVRRFVGRKPRQSFYLTGPCGQFARVVNAYIDHVIRKRELVDRLFGAESLDEQRRLYESEARDAFWGPFMRWLVGRDASLALLGVPLAQRRQLEKDYEGGVARFIQDAIDAVFTEIPLRDNYFWRVYLYGGYSETCRPEYLTPAGFETLRDGRLDRVSTHSMAVHEFLAGHEGKISKFVLLDHMDWLSTNAHPVLAREWQEIVDHAAPGARVLWRSGGLSTDFVEQVEVTVDGRRSKVGDLITYDRDLARELHAKDRVHTYGSFAIADLSIGGANT